MMEATFTTPGNLADGVQYRRRKRLPPVIPSHTIPMPQDNTIVIAACGVPTSAFCIPTTTPKHDDGGDEWFMSDFCAMNLMLRHRGKKQTWLSVESHDSLLQHLDDQPLHQGCLLHGDPSRERVVVFRRDIVDQGLLTPFTTVRPNEIIDAIRKEIREACILAKQSSPPCPVMLLLFGHNLTTFGVALDYSAWRNEGVRSYEDERLQDLASDKACFLPEDAKRCIDPEVSFTIISTACYSGHWVVDPEFNQTILAASDASATIPPPVDDMETYLSTSHGMSRSIGRMCGSLFIETLLRSLMSSQSAFVTAEHRASMDERATEEPLQPENPTEEQSETFNEFQNTMRRVLADEVTNVADRLPFLSTAQDDNLDVCSWAVIGAPTNDFAAVWNSLPRCPPTVQPESDDKVVIYHTGGGAGTRAVRRNDRLNALTIVASCPGDWQKGRTLRTRQHIFKFIRGQPMSPQGEEGVILAIRHRVEMAQCLDSLTEELKLSRPDGHKMLQWDHDRYWEVRRDYPDLAASIEKTMRASGLWFRWRPELHFARPIHYLLHVFVLVAHTTPDRPLNEIILLVAQHFDWSQKAIANRAFEAPEVKTSWDRWAKLWKKVHQGGRVTKLKRSKTRREGSSSTRNGSKRWSTG